MALGVAQSLRVEQALSHSSLKDRVGGPSTNEALATLGDAVLRLVVMKRAWSQMATPDSLSEAAKQAVTNPLLWRAADDAGLWQFIDVSAGSEKDRRQRETLAKSLEALVGAVFLDEDFDAADACASQFLDKRVHLGPPPGA